MGIKEINIVALLPMKGNSERIPNKNLKSFAGKPLYHTIVDTLVTSKYIKQIIVDTDSEAIKADIIRNYKFIDIINRPAEIQGDFTPMNSIIAYDISQTNSEFFLQTHSTNPLLTIESLDKAIEIFYDHKTTHDSLFSVTRIQSRLYWKDGKSVNHNPNELLRTQDLEPIFNENSNFYIFSKLSFSNAGNRRIGLRPLMFEVDKIEATDIDEPQDFIIAEALYNQIRQP